MALVSLHLLFLIFMDCIFIGGFFLPLVIILLSTVILWFLHAFYGYFFLQHFVNLELEVKSKLNIIIRL